jgi:hypothetical protein
MKFVIVVEGPATPAPLVRLITPGTFVAQTTTGEAVAAMAAWEGPGVVAIMPEGSAEFVHDPSGGEQLGQRLVVTNQPDGTTIRRVGPFTVAQQRDELLQLRSLAVSATGPTSRDAVGAEADDPVGKLAAWLLSQAEDTVGSKDRQGG